MRTPHKAIEKAKQELEQMMDSHPGGMLLVNRDGEIQRANRAMLGFLGAADFRDIIGRSLDEIFPVAVADRRGTARDAFFSRLVEGQSDYIVREVNVCPGGRGERLLRFSVVRSGKNTALRVVAIDDAALERQQAASLEKQFKKEAVAALTGALLHHVNQPLTAIMALSHLMHLDLKDAATGPVSMKKNIEEIMRLTMQIADMLDRLKTPSDFVVKPYLPGVDILDIERSGGNAGTRAEAAIPFETLESFCVSGLDVVLKALDAGNPGGSLHARRTGELAASLAAGLGLDAMQVAKVKQCGVLHDIGKIGVPDRILQKPGRLTAVEKKVMQAHVQTGHAFLGAFPFLADEAEVAYAHHERYDGKGYPRGLAGKDIHLSARIVTVADALDALRQSRAYHAALPAGRAIRRIIAGAGAQFDPDVVAVFEQLCKNPGFVDPS